MNKQCLATLKERGIDCDRGLTFKEVAKIEDIYKISFPESLRDLLMEVLPVSEGFYNWRDVNEDNVAFIKERINWPVTHIFSRTNEVYWCDDWGNEPKNVHKRELVIKQHLENAPKLIPIYAHRYMPMIADKNPPIISVHGTDIIYYGENIEDYIAIEFGEKKQCAIDFQNIRPIRFWTEIM